MRINLKSFKLILLVFLLSLSMAGNAQEKQKDVVYLKNGSIIKGIILEIIPNETIKIETADGSIFIYKLEEVEKTIKEEETKKIVAKEKIKKGLGDQFEATGYFIMVRLGPMLPVGLSGDPNTAIGFINGLQINKNISFGFGIDVADYSYNNQRSKATIVPIFLDSRFYFSTNRVHPMISLQCGYSLTGNSSGEINTSQYNPSLSKGGIFAAFGIGIRVFVNQKISLITDGGLSLQNLKGYNDLTYGSIVFPDRDIISLKVNVGIAVSFGKGKKQAN